MARPSLADSLKASLSKGIHVDTAEKIARGFLPISDDFIEQSFQQPPPRSVVQTDRKPNNSLANKSLDVNNAIDDSSGKKRPNNTEDHQTVRPSDSLTVEQSDARTDTPSNHQTVQPLDRQTIRQIIRPTIRPSDCQTNYQTPSQYVPLEVLNLSYNQACVLEYLINNTSGITNYRTVAETAQMGIPSAREALSRLVVKGFMLKPVTVKTAAFQGFSYILNKVLCDHFLNAGGLSQANYRNPQTVNHTVRPSDNTTVKHTDRQTLHSSSESFLESKTTTTPVTQTVNFSLPQTITPSDGEHIKPSDGFVLTGAVGVFWEEEGLGESQTQKWCGQFEVDASQMRQQLEWARFDLENNGRRSEVRKDLISWFFGHLRATGGSFPRPVNYRSPTEIRAEAIELELTREKEARERLVAAELEREFQTILHEPDGNAYQELINQVNEFARGMGGQALETILREEFLKKR